METESELIRNNKKIGLRDIVAGPAMTQSIKGIFTAGPLKTTRYALEKLLKWKQAKK